MQEARFPSHACEQRRWRLVQGAREMALLRAVARFLRRPAIACAESSAWRGQLRLARAAPLGCSRHPEMSASNVPKRDPTNHCFIGVRATVRDRGAAALSRSRWGASNSRPTAYKAVASRMMTLPDRLRI